MSGLLGHYEPSQELVNLVHSSVQDIALKYPAMYLPLDLRQVKLVLLALAIVQEGIRRVDANTRRRGQKAK